MPRSHAVFLLLFTFQGEREHRVGKGRFLRTSRKNFVRQLTQIERRQSRIRRIREGADRDVTHPVAPLEPIAKDPKEHYQVGKSQNHPVDVLSFCWPNSGDAAITNVSDAR